MRHGIYPRHNQKEDIMAKIWNTKAIRAKKMKLARQLNKMCRELHRMCRHLKQM